MASLGDSQDNLIARELPMPIEIVTVPCLSDNYAFLIHDDDTGQTALVDAPEAHPIQVALDARGWTLSQIWITHHHGDHIDGVADLRECAMVVGNEYDARRLPALDAKVTDGETFDFAGNDVLVMDVSGHTIGHIAFYLPGANAVFTADSLMALGCGRLFEGTPELMWSSLSKLAALPRHTIVCSGHEYTASNAKFALTVETENEALHARAAEIAETRAKGKPTVPSTLAEELATNPFLRANLPEVKAAIGMPNASDGAVFAEIRQRKDRF